jgi:GT2 family glycosyltransferase
VIRESLASVAIVVVNYGSSELLEQNLLPLARQSGSRIVVVDNLTTAAERSRVVALCEREGWSAVLPDGNTGFGGGMNLGVARALADGAGRFLLLNPDATIAVPDLEVLLARSIRDPLTLLAPRIVRPDGSVWFDGVDLYLDDGRIRSPRRRQTLAPDRWEPWLSGACLIVTATLWSAVGGFDESYFLYWEDVDLSHRVLAAGGSLEVCAEATAVHSEGGTQGGEHSTAGEPKSATYYFYNIRNRMLFAANNLGADDVDRWRRLIVRVAWETLLQGGRRQFLRSPEPLLAGLRGVRAARRIAKGYTPAARVR